MTRQIRAAHRRVLVVDDNPTIHEDVRKILAPHPADELADRARRDRRPYAIAFVDARMPPGLDGIETIARLWKTDPDIQVVLCTAYSDHSWPQLRRRLEHPERLIVLKKPFDNIEVQQLAESLTEKWALARAEQQRLQGLERSISERNRDALAARPFDYVRAYRINHLKIAQSFVARSCSDLGSAATISAIVNFARDVGVGVIAQGVETEEQRVLLSETDSSAQAQGFHFSRAVGAAEAADLLRRGRIVNEIAEPETCVA